MGIQYNVDYEQKQEDVYGYLLTRCTVKVIKNKTPDPHDSCEEFPTEVATERAEPDDVEGSSHLGGKDGISKLEGVHQRH